MDRMSGFEHRTRHFSVNHFFALLGAYELPRSVRGVKGMSSDGLGPKCVPIVIGKRETAYTVCDILALFFQSTEFSVRDFFFDPAT